MKAVFLTGRDGFSSLQLGEQPDVTPGSRQILVRLRAASLNFRDLAIARGTYGDFALPIVPVSDGAGEVVAVGEEVTRFRVGDWVCPHYVVDWLAGAPTAENVRRRLGGPNDGVLRETICVDAKAAVRMPVHMTSAQAATLPIAGLTAWQALFVRDRVQPGDVVVVQGTGGVSIFALQLARSAGAFVIVTSSSDEKLERAMVLGASHTINYRETPDWQTKVLDWTEGRGADHVLEVVGGDNINRSIAACRIGGTLSLIGFLSDTKASINLPAAFAKMVTMNAISVGSRTAFEGLVRACEVNGILPSVDSQFALEDTQSAYEYLARGQHFGKVVIEIP